MNITLEQKAPPSEMSASLLGMYLFLASEAMFFVGLLGSFVVLESAGGQHDLFVHSSGMLNSWIIFSSVTLLVLSSGILFRKEKSYPRIALLMGLVFIVVQSGQWIILLSHHTCAVKSAVGIAVYDGSESPDGSTLILEARRISLRDDLDIHAITAGDFLGKLEYSTIKNEDIRQDLNYGPSRNNFFACYFLFTAVHVVHLIAGIIAVGWFLIFSDRPGSSGYLRDRRPRGVPPAVQIYWHFINAVGVIGFAVLYFV